MALEMHTEHPGALHKREGCACMRGVMRFVCEHSLLARSALLIYTDLMVLVLAMVMAEEVVGKLDNRNDTIRWLCRRRGRGVSLRLFCIGARFATYQAAATSSSGDLSALVCGHFREQ